MGIYQSMRASLNDEKEIFKRNELDIKKSNATILKGLVKVGACSFFILFLISYFEKTYTVMRSAYLFMTIISIFIMLVIKFSKKISELFLLYFSFTFIIGVCIYSSSFYTSETTSVITVIILVLAPVTILDKNWRIFIMEISFMLASIIFTILYKDQLLVVDECVNIVTASILGFVLGKHLSTTQIDNFDLKRQSIFRENTDTLTQVSSRKKLFEDLASDKFNEISSVIMLDIDNFKAYNDYYGHQIGDKCLKDIGQAFLDVSKQLPIYFYRYGGEEFIGIIYEQNEINVQAICQKIVDKIFSLKISHEKTPYRFVSVSVGVAFQENNKNYDTLINEADKALYNAKRSGKNTFHIHENK